MALASYSELVSEMEEWLNRADLSARIPSFIRLFEARMNRRLRAPDMEQTFSFTTVSGTLSYPLNVRVRELHDVYISSDGSVDAEYAVVGENIVFEDDPGDGVTIVYSAFVTLSGLGVGTTTNWLLDDHPDAYLYGSLAEAYAFERDEEQAAKYKALSDEALKEITDEANQKRLPAGPLQSQPAVRE